jgi:hypothetical protein
VRVLHWRLPRRKVRMQLTVQQAEAEARWRWGGLLTRGIARHSMGLRLPFEVGTNFFGAITIRGRGNSWESAFRNAAETTNGGK